MIRRAMFPGSFDPFTIGHESIVLRSLELFDEIIIAIGANSAKNDLLPLEVRLQLINEVFSQERKVTVAIYEGLTYNYAKQIGANFLIRGLRNGIDLEYERTIAEVNRSLGNIESVFLMTLPVHIHISSTVIRDLIHNGGDPSELLPKCINIYDYLK